MKFASAIALLSVTSAAEWNYLENGADWPTATPACKDTNQSPIDLPMPGSIDQKVDLWTDKFSTVYGNPQGSSVFWNGHTSQVNINPLDTQVFGFNSMHGEDKGFSKQWKTAQFHFHTHSEHSVNGKYFDLEMHAVHAP